MTTVLGVVIILFVLLVALPVSYLIGGGILAAIFGTALNASKPSED